MFFLSFINIALANKKEEKNPFSKKRKITNKKESKYKLNLDLSDEKIKSGEDASINELLEISNTQHTGSENSFFEIKDNWKDEIWSSIYKID